MIHIYYIPLYECVMCTINKPYNKSFGVLNRNINSLLYLSADTGKIKTRKDIKKKWKLPFQIFLNELFSLEFLQLFKIL